MKAILILDMPEDCGQCPFMKSVDVIPTYYWYCTADIHNLISLSERLEGREEWCPLKPMPERRQDIEEANLEAMFNDGWNACLDELEEPNGLNSALEDE